MESNTEQTIFSGQAVNKRSLTIKAKCLKGLESTLACNNASCEQYAFVCGNRKCECRIPHKKCLFTCTDQIIQLIEEKREQSSEVIDKVSLVLDKWIDEISKTREEIQDMLLDWGLSGPQKKFIQIIQKQDYKQLNGAHINQITTQTIEYFSEQIKQKLFTQIQKVEENYKAQINAMNKAVLSLFQKYQIQQKDVAFKENIEVQIEGEFHFISQVSKFRDQHLRKIGKLNIQDYYKSLAFIKDALKKDFEAHMIKYKRNRRAYGNRKLRQKYFDDYHLVLSKGKQHMQKWQLDTEQQMKHLNKMLELELAELSVFYRSADGLLEKPFTSEMAHSFQAAVNAIYKVIDFAKSNGKEKLQFLNSRDKILNDDFEVAMYFLDQVMDDHPQIDQIQVIWNCIRNSEKIKGELELLFEIIKETKNQVYNYEIK